MRLERCGNKENADLDVLTFDLEPQLQTAYPGLVYS